jgi:pyrroline-5-carboxylate reductase
MRSKIVFIGGGNMAGALVGGMAQAGYPMEDVWVVEPDTSKHGALREYAGLNVTDQSGEADDAAVIVLAVKPQILQSVARSFAASVQKNKALVVSIAAGIHANDLSRWLGGNVSIVRAMPNTPSMVQTGATALLANEHCSEKHRQLAEMILRAVGLTVWVKSESQMDAVTAVSGSGPAYYFMFMNAMATAGVELGLDAATSRLLTVQTALGAAKMALESSDELSTLQSNVTSPKGTTFAAIQSFEANGLPDLVEKAMQACAERSAELARELGTDALPNHSGQ